MMKRQGKRILVPPLLVAACWAIFIYGGLVHFMDSRGDYASVFCFAALVFGLLYIPGALTVHFVLWLSAPATTKTAISASLIGWMLALVLLIGGFAVVPWSQGWP